MTGWFHIGTTSNYKFVESIKIYKQVSLLFCNRITDISSQISFPTNSNKTENQGTITSL